MALARKVLKATGVEDERADEIIDAHAEAVDALKRRIAGRAGASRRRLASARWSTWASARRRARP